MVLHDDDDHGDHGHDGDDDNDDDDDDDGDGLGGRARWRVGGLVGWRHIGSECAA